jgi:hypothetical protein
MPKDNIEPDQYQYDYGVISDQPLTELQLLLLAFKLNPPIDSGGIGRARLFWKIADCLWGVNSESIRKFTPHPWAERMTELACEHQYLGVHGSASSGKSLWGALWGFVNWASDPENTLVLMTSTSLRDSRRRIWGCMKDYFMAVADQIPFGKLIDSQGVIRTIGQDGVALSEKSGIALIPGERKREKDAIGKLIGMRNKKVFMIADELPELSESLIAAAMSNLAVSPYFQMIGLGNFNSIYDPLGVFVTPKSGWGSVSVDDEEWETVHGYCLHLDGMKSPNIIAGEDIYPIYNNRNLVDHQKRFGENSALFWRMCRSFPSPEGETKAIYSDSDFIKGDVLSPVQWLDRPVPVAAADPAFTTDGDVFSGAFGLFGRSAAGMPVLLVTEVRKYHENMELSKSGEARDLQTARMFSADCAEHGCSRDNVGLDCSGPGGLAFGSIFSMFWGNRYLPIKFQESGSEMPVSLDDPRKGHEAFSDLSSEIWFIGKSFVRAGQFKGIDGDVARELKSRFYKTEKRGDFVKIKIEPKVEMRRRLGFSPDAADSVLMLLHLCRERFGFTAGSIINQRQTQTINQEWMNRARSAHSIYENAFTS